MQVLRTGSLVAAVALACLAGLLAQVAPVEARDDYTNRIGVFLGGGAGKYVGGLSDHSSVGPIFQGGFRFGWLRHWELEANARFGTFKASTIPEGQDFENKTTAFEINTVYNWKPDGKWNPQAWIGLGAVFWKVVDVNAGDGEVVRGFKGNGDPTYLTDTNFAGNLGVALEYNISGRWAVRGALRSDWLWGIDTDNTGASAAFDSIAQNRQAADVNNFLPAAIFSLTYFFSERDSDADGVPNSRDGCPYDAEDIDGYQDEDGCPDLDNDGDGVLDINDGCPDEAEDVDGYQDEDGCPDLDNDGDGIPDLIDECPNEPEDFDGFEDEDGCPDLDNDADGVIDAFDQCPETPVGIAVDSLGCPQVARIETELILSGVTFRPGSADLTAASYASLDSVVMSLLAYPGVEIEIQGHTDSQGDADKNLLLSQDRAEAVARYLTDNGIAAYRLTPIGYGADLPIAPNETADGRAKNRRVTVLPIQNIPLESFDSGNDDLDDLDDLDEDLDDLDPDDDDE
jgi:outer membrane protein OmpA-like peptidoglycan-associated protein